MNSITKFLIFSVVFLIPSYLIRFSIFGIPTNVLEILIYLTFFSYLLEIPAINWKRLYENYRTYIFSVALIFIGLVISTLVNQNYREGFGIIKGWFFDPLLFSFILINKIKTEKELQNILKIFYFSGVLVGLVSLVYFFLGKLTFDNRLAAFYSSPNYLAMFLAPSLFIGIYLLTLKKLNFKFIYFSSLIIIFGTIYLTFSYAAWLSIALSLIIIGFITKKINKKIILISSAIIFIALLSQLKNPKLNNIFSDRSSLQSRTMIWQSSAKILKDNFIFGIGPGNFQNKYLEYQKYFPPYLEWAVPQPHNLFLAFWLQGGIIGFIGFIFLIFNWLKRILKNQKNSPLLTVSLAIILYFLIHGLADTTYWKNDLALIFWVILFLGIKD